MSGKGILQVLGSLEELNILQKCENCSKIITFKLDATNYGLLIYTVDEYRISFLKLNFNELFSNASGNSQQNILKTSIGKELYKIYLLNVFCFSFTLVDVICTSNNIWVIGQETVLDIKPYIESALKNDKSVEDVEYMDADHVEEFNHEMFDINIDVQESEKYDFHHGDIFVGCNFIDYGFVLCHKKSSTRWHLEVVLPNNRLTLSPDLTTTFLEFPVSFEANISIDPSEGQKDTCDPFIVFIHYSDPERLIFENLFGINCSSSNAICLVGHPEGKLLWSLCDYNSKFHSSVKLQTLFDIKQSIIGVYFIKELKDSGYMLIVGSLGHVTLISSKEHAAFTFVSGPHPFWTTTVYLKSSITHCVVVKDYLLHFSSDGILWITELSELLDFNQTDKDFCLASSCSELSCVEQVIDIDKNQGLILLKVSSGNLYLTLCQKGVDSNISSSSLPSLMNECLAQSISMQELLQKKVLQSRLFATISVFASLKFSENILKEPITFSLSEINMQPRKYLLVINLKCFEKLNLDSELCHVSASVFTYIKSDYSLVSKTISYNPDEPTLCLELTDTVLQPPFVSVFPLLVEIGLILQLPDKWKVIDCFKTITKCLPYYLRIQNFMVHELHLFQSNALCPPQSFKFDKPKKTFQIIKELGLKRPISNVLQMDLKNDYNVPEEFNLCLSASTVEEMMKSTRDSDPCIFIKRLLFGNKQLDVLPEGTHLTSKNCPVSVSVAKNNNYLVITVNANSFDTLIALRIAVMDILLSYHNQIKCSSNSSAYVSIPASIYRRCEEISKALMNLYGKDIESREVTQSLLQLYEELRRDISGKLPIL